MATLDFEDFDGVKMPSDFHLYRERIENLEVRNDDIWVTSYPKTGTTWCQEMVWLIGNDMDYVGAEAFVLFRYPYIELNGFSEEMLRFCKKHNLSTFFEDLPDQLHIVDNMKGKRYIKTHLPWNFLPKQIIEGHKTPKIIHIMRNPKQVVPSWFHHCASILPMFVGSLDQFVDLYIKGDLLYGDYFKTVLSYWEQRHLPNLLIITYEEMHGDMPNVIKKVSDFLGKSYNEEEIKKLAHHLSFDQMKNNLAVNVQTLIQNEEIQFIRKGATDSYKQELTAEMINKLDKWAQKNVQGTGLPYENC